MNKIEWIKFKRSTEEDRRKEVIYPCGMMGKVGGRIYEKKEDTYGYDILAYSFWAPLNLPEEEKWERKCELRGRIAYGEEIELEFDNIYSILNELKEKIK